MKTRKLLLSACLVATPLLGGCQALAGANAVAGALDALSAQGGGGMTLEKVAIQACGKQAIQYGTVSITDMDRRGPDTVHMSGHIQADTGYQRLFTCTFNTAGQVQFNVT